MGATVICSVNCIEHEVLGVSSMIQVPQYVAALSTQNIAMINPLSIQSRRNGMYRGPRVPEVSPKSAVLICQYRYGRMADVCPGRLLDCLAWFAASERNLKRCDSKLP